MIPDPLAVVMAYLSTHPALALLAGRIAAKHKFALEDGGDVWALGSQALRVQPLPGPADTDFHRQTLDMAATCYGASQASAMEVYRALVTVSRTTERTLVAAADGTVLLYFALIVSTPVLGVELIGDVHGVDYAQFTLRTAIAECYV